MQKMPAYMRFGEIGVKVIARISVRPLTVSDNPNGVQSRIKNNIEEFYTCDFAHIMCEIARIITFRVFQYIDIWCFWIASQGRNDGQWNLSFLRLFENLFTWGTRNDGKTALTRQ